MNQHDYQQRLRELRHELERADYWLDWYRTNYRGADRDRQIDLWSQRRQALADQLNQLLQTPQ
jgi:hypothetical protein